MMGREPAGRTFLVWPIPVPSIVGKRSRQVLASWNGQVFAGEAGCLALVDLAMKDAGEVGKKAGARSECFAKKKRRMR